VETDFDEVYDDPFEVCNNAIIRQHKLRHREGQWGRHTMAGTLS
jgi:hypothetical protein